MSTPSSAPAGSRILELSHSFFDEIVHPILARDFPNELSQMTIGVFGYGSDVLGLDDDYSQDHHWGLRVNALLPNAAYRERAASIQDALSTALPAQWRGHELGEGYTRLKGLSLGGYEDHLLSTIGLDHAPATLTEWLSFPEEDVMHVVAGEVWHDPTGQFSAVRAALGGYYPEPVRVRRLAHWCRYFSGMGVYALKRALLRGNELYASTTFARALRWGVQIAFLLDRQYFPYDKWLTTYFNRLPRMAARLRPIVEEAPKLSTSWDRKLELLEQMSDVLDQALVEDGLIQPHPKFQGSATSGYRLMEYAYAELVKSCPAEIKDVVPVWDQVYWEKFHSRFVDQVDMRTWQGLLNLSP